MWLCCERALLTTVVCCAAGDMTEIGEKVCHVSLIQSGRLLVFIMRCQHPSSHALMASLHN